MKRLRSIYDLIDRIEQYTSMFIPDKSLESLLTYLNGYSTCLEVHRMVEVDVPDFNHFGDWLNNHFDWNLSYGWAKAINEHIDNENERLPKFFSLVVEFRKLQPEVVKSVTLGSKNMPTGKRYLVGDGTLMDKPEKIEIIQYSPEQLFFLRFFYEAGSVNDKNLFISESDARSWVEDEFLVEPGSWE